MERIELDKKQLRESIHSRIVIQGEKECWLWRNSRGKSQRYPRRSVAGKIYLVAALLMWIEGYTEEPFQGSRQEMLCHSCDNGEIGCVRPDHIFVGDQFINMQDSRQKGRNCNAAKEFCVNGHPLTDPLVGRHYGKYKAARRCLMCKRDSERAKNNIPPEKWKGNFVEKGLIDGPRLLEALEICKGYKKDAAKYLGISVSSFFRKWEQAGFETNVPGTRKRPIRTPRTRVECCKRGHPFTPENTYVNRQGRRNCKICLKDWHTAKVAPKRDARKQKDNVLAAFMAGWGASHPNGGNESEGARQAGVPRTTWNRKWKQFFGDEE